ncbi:3307_t:CDS:1, partial [Diversispora eburnea]
MSNIEDYSEELFEYSEELFEELSEEHLEEHSENYISNNEVFDVQNTTTSSLKKRISKIYQYFTYGTDK